MLKKVLTVVLLVAFLLPLTSTNLFAAKKNKNSKSDYSKYKTTPHKEMYHRISPWPIPGGKVDGEEKLRHKAMKKSGKK